MLKNATSILSQFVSEARLARMQQVLKTRTLNRVRLVFEKPYNEFNILACARTADSFGIQNIDIVRSEKTKISAKLKAQISGGTNDWLDITTHGTSPDCVKKLKEQNYKICVTDLGPGAVSYHELECNIIKPTLHCGGKYAFVFGTEKFGISEEMASLADVRWYLPMMGMAQSFNMSVSVAVLLANLNCGGVIPEPRGLFPEEERQQQEIMLRWLCLHVDGFDQILARENINISELLPALKVRRGKVAPQF